MCEFRKLRADELQIKCTDTKFKGGATLLIYKDARVDQKVLDESVGPMRWQKDYKDIDGKVYCGVAIKDKDTNEWVWKWDCGTEGNFEAEKSEASDAFKRACFNWGLGRELYDTPKIRIKCQDNYYYNDKLTMTFSVAKIEWDGDNLMQLVIVDKFNKVVFDFTEKTNDVPTKDTNVSKDKNQLLMDFCTNEAKSLTEEEKANLRAFCKFYKEKEWKGDFDPERLWNNWKSRTRKAA